MYRKIYLKPIAFKSIYDFLIFFYASAILLIDNSNRGEVLLLVAFCGGFYALCSNYILKGVKALRVKLLVLTILLIVSSAPLIGVGQTVEQICLFILMAAPMIIIPRVLFSYVENKGDGLLSLIVTSRKPVLVVGGAGYIGSYVVEYLLNQGYSVRVLDKLLFGDKALERFKKHREFELIDGDVTDIEKLTFALRNVQAVVHLGGLVGDPACAIDERLTRQLNVVATRMLMQVSKSVGVSRFIFASSCSVYGVNDNKVDESSILNPVSLYAETKIDSERELLPQSSEQFAVTILRFATVFGHSFRPRFDLVVNLFTALAMTGKKITVIGSDQWRPFIHVRDLARAVVMTLNADVQKIEGKIFNVGDEKQNATILDVANIVKKVALEYGIVTDIEINDDQSGDRRNYLVNFTKIKHTLGYSAEIGLEDGIREMAEKINSQLYDEHTSKLYSNVAITKLVADEYFDPKKARKLYAPIID